MKKYLHVESDALASIRGAAPHQDGSESCPTLATLAQYAHCHRATARRNVQLLIPPVSPPGPIGPAGPAGKEGWVLEDGVGPLGQAKYRLPLGSV